MSEDGGAPVKISVKNGLSPGGGAICLAIGIGMLIPGLIYLPNIGLTFFGIIFVLVGAVGPRVFFKFTRLPDGLQYRRRYQTYFYP